MPRKKTPAVPPPAAVIGPTVSHAGRTVRIARPDLSRVTIPTPADPDIRDRDGSPRPQSITVWRYDLPASVRAFPADLQAALMTYADARGALDASGPAPNLSGVRASGGLPAGPSLSRLIAAERLRHMDAALSGIALRIVAKPHRAARACAARAYSASGRDLATWLAIDGLTVAQIFARMGLARPTRAHAVALRDVAFQVAAALSVAINSPNRRIKNKTQQKKAGVIYPL